MRGPLWKTVSPACRTASRTSERLTNRGNGSAGIPGLTAHLPDASTRITAVIATYPSCSHHRCAERLRLCESCQSRTHCGFRSSLRFSAASACSFVSPASFWLSKNLWKVSGLGEGFPVTWYSRMMSAASFVPTSCIKRQKGGDERNCMNKRYRIGALNGNRYLPSKISDSHRLHPLCIPSHTDDPCR